MILKNKLAAGELWDVNVPGTSFAVVRALTGVFARFFDEHGSVKLETEIYQGMNLNSVKFARVAIYTEFAMDIAIWVSWHEYHFTPQPMRSNMMTSRQITLMPGVNKLLDYDPPRLKTTITCDRDMYIGGSNMTSGAGIVQNGRLYEAGRDIEINSYGELYYWVTDETTTKFYENQLMEPARYAWPKSQMPTRSEMEAGGVRYVDIVIPPELDNQYFYIYANAIVDVQRQYPSDPYDWEGTHETNPALFWTVGDEQSEQLEFGGGWRIGSGGRSCGEMRARVRMSAGTHRVFMVESFVDGDVRDHYPLEYYGTSFTYFLDLYAEVPVLVSAGIAQVLEERV
ncbi:MULTISPECIES: hypothetical protein [unclassified Pseudoalteromonas]|uniref:hypothetical protein n=2 Tax=Pseudoalteromonas TaxID=53246 RepID=UPI001F3CD76A|nr:MULTISPECIES: hypothetical protein [unclassified Pseudoalteromonas]MCF2825691.1 hypothetical protein [Pseudoalteromonas sp. OF5H-5]MCF2923749.1 hypothetical protein [Pseudoalteromonas sp. DL2-H1]